MRGRIDECWGGRGECVGGMSADAPKLWLSIVLQAKAHSRRPLALCPRLT